MLDCHKNADDVTPWQLRLSHKKDMMLPDMTITKIDQNQNKIFYNKKLQLSSQTC